MKNNKILSATISYSIVRYLIVVIGLVKGIVTAKYLGPSLLGTYGLMNLILGYLRYGDFGVYAAMNLEVSINRKDKSKKEHVEQIIGNAFSCCLIISSFYVVIGFFSRLMVPQIFPTDLLPYAYAIAFLGICDQLRTFSIVHARFNENVWVINIIEFSSSVMTFIGICLLISEYSLNGVIWASILSGYLLCVVCIFSVRRIRLSLDKNRIALLIRIGQSLLFYNVSEEVFVTLDKIFIARFFPRDSLGYYTLSSSMASNTIVILTAFTFLYYPKFLELLSKGVDTAERNRQLEKYVVDYSGLLALITTLLGLTGIILIEPFIRLFLPEYVKSISLYRIIIVGTISMQISYFAKTLLIANKRYLQFTLFICCLICLAAILDYCMILLDGGLTGVALATCFSLFLNGIGSFFLAFKLINGDCRNIVTIYYKFILFSVPLLLVIIFNDRFVFCSIPFFFFLYWKELNGLILMIQSMRRTDS